MMVSIEPGVWRRRINCRSSVRCLAGVLRSGGDALFSGRIPRRRTEYGEVPERARALRVLAGCMGEELAVLRDCLGGLPLGVVHEREPVVRLGIVRIERNGALQLRRGLLP